jgi:uroporphyrinogen decarboxylase
MTHKERFLAAVAHREPDRVPLCMDAEKEVWPNLAAALGGKTKEDCTRALEIDEWMLDPHVTDPRARKISGSERLSQWGYRIREIKTEFGSYGDICEPPLKDADDDPAVIRRYDWPDPALIQFDHYAAKMREMGERAYIAHITHGPYFNCTYLRCMEQYLMDIAMSPISPANFTIASTRSIFPS